MDPKLRQQKLQRMEEIAEEFRALAAELNLDRALPVCYIKDIKTIQEIVAAHFNVPVEALNSKLKFAEYAQARQVAMYFAKTYTAHSHREVGICFGDRTRGSIIFACKAFADRVAIDRKFADSMKVLRTAIEAQFGQPVALQRKMEAVA